MATIRRFEDIEAWKIARRMTVRVYEVTAQDQFSKDFALRNQIRDASGSSMHNIAEGFDAGSDAEFCRFLRYARRSATEVQSELYVAIDQSYVGQAEFSEIYDLADQCKRKINGLIGYLKRGKPH